MKLVSAQYAKCQTPPLARNICYIALNSIPTNKCSRTPSNSTGMPAGWWDNVSTFCHTNNNNNISRTCYKLHLFWPASVFPPPQVRFQFCPVICIVLYIPVLFHRFTVFIATLLHHNHYNVFFLSNGSYIDYLSFTCATSNGKNIKSYTINITFKKRGNIKNINILKPFKISTEVLMIRSSPEAVTKRKVSIPSFLSWPPSNKIIIIIIKLWWIIMLWIS